MRILDQPKITWAYIWCVLFVVSLSAIASLVFILKIQEVRNDQNLNQVLKETEKKGVWVFIPDQYIDAYDNGWGGIIKINFANSLKKPELLTNK